MKNTLTFSVIIFLNLLIFNSYSQNTNDDYFENYYKN